MKNLLGYILQLLFLLNVTVSKAQSTNWYYDQQTRYGTFRHYSNGGAKLITTSRGGRDYAGEMAASYQELVQMKEERERQRMIEIERMRRESLQQGSSGSTSAVQKNYGPTPADLARQEQQEKDRFYKQYEELLHNANGLSNQALILSEMYKLRPNDTVALRLFGIYAKLGREEDMDRLNKSFSASFIAENHDIIWSGWGHKSYIAGTYKLVLMYLAKINEPDLNSFAQTLCSHLRLHNWNELPVLLEKYSSRFPELLSVSPKLTSAFRYLSARQIGTTEAKATAAELHQFAVTRRENRIMDFVNIVVLDAAVSLDPENSIYREERFNSNSILQLKPAMQEDYDFFSR